MMQERMTAAQFRQQFGAAAPKRVKYGNKKTVIDGATFDSQAEARRYCELKQLLRAGEIRGFARQPSFIIDVAGTRYRPDFIVCGAGGDIWVEDVKGCETPKFKRDRLLWEATYWWMPLKIIRG